MTLTILPYGDAAGGAWYGRAAVANWAAAVGWWAAEWWAQIAGAALGWRVVGADVRDWCCGRWVWAVAAAARVGFAVQFH